MTDQFELHKQNTQVYGTKWPPEYRGRGKKKTKQYIRGVEGVNSTDAGHSPVEWLSHPWLS